MAPTKRSRDNAAKNRDKNRRRKRTQENTGSLFKFMGQLCGEECEKDLTSVPDITNRSRREGRRHDVMDDVKMNTGGEISDGEFDNVRSAVPVKSGRINKSKLPKKSGQNMQTTEMRLNIGVQKAIRYICAALDFGVQSGYLTPKNAKGNVLRVSSDLLQSSDPSRNRGLQRIGSDALDPRSDRRYNRKQQRRPEPMESDINKLPSGNSRSAEDRDDDVASIEDRGHKRSKPRSRSGSKVKRRFGKSRSRSRSVKRKHLSKKRTIRSRSEKPDPKQVKSEQEGEQDEMDENNKDSSGNNNIDEDNDDAKSVKSCKSAKSTLNSESQNTNEEKKLGDEDTGSGDEDEDDEDEKK